MALPNVCGAARLISDPELRFTASGAAVAKLRLAFNSRKKTDSGEWVDADVFYVDGTLWRQAAENAVESLSKGDEVVVTGRIKTRSWEGDDGQKRSMPELMIDSVGPSVRSATVTVNRVARSGAGNATSDPWAAGGDDAPPF